MKSFSVLALIWTLYYLAKRTTANLLTTVDLVVCGCVLLFCIVNLLIAIHQKYQTYQNHIASTSKEENPHGK
ncbi:MAG: hypothetical protein UEP78_02425 [Negativibacillus sp.]|nr:hypothetical protein [Negativibacillus sp.]